MSFERAQALVLLELVVDPPSEGDRFSDLAARLEISPNGIAAAVAALSCSDLAQIYGDVVRATRAALRFEALWPIAPCSGEVLQSNCGIEEDAKRTTAAIGC